MEAFDQKPMEQTRVLAWSLDGLLFERYTYPPGPVGVGERHAHEGYQICLSEDFPGRNHLRGGTVAVPVGAVSVIHPGEAHSSSDPFDREAPSSYRLFYLEAPLLGTVLELPEGEEPFFAEPVVTDVALFDPLLRAHIAAERRWPRLEREAMLRTGLRALAEAMGILPRLRQHPPSTVSIVRDRIHAEPGADLSLRELALLAGLSEGHLVRSFVARHGMPPHAYQIAIRIERAKTLLQKGHAPAWVAAELGFSDQAHFARRFKRLVGVTPGRYRGLA